MISFDKIDNDTERQNPKWCDSCGRTKLEMYRLNYGTGITEGNNKYFCFECAEELFQEVRIALDKRYS